LTQSAREKLTVREVIGRYGHCIDLVSMDRHFNDISVGLFVKGRRFTVWSYTTVPGVEKRLVQIRDRLVAWGEMTPVADSSNQADYAVGELLERPLRFLFMEAVDKDPSTPIPSGRIEARDTKTLLTFVVSGKAEGDKYVYTAAAEGDEPRADMRVKAVVGGYMRYGSCLRVAPTKFTFPDGERHDGFARLLLHYARNVTGVENMLAANELQGQMTTQTLGFSRS
jgi:hypothetical protein